MKSHPFSLSETSFQTHVFSHSTWAPIHTAVVHQPGSEVFDQLDTLCLLSGGQTVYFGRADEAVQFVEEAGLPCPARINIADYLLHLTNKDFDTTNQKVGSF